MKEVASAMGEEFNTVRLGKVEKTGELRDGSTLLRAVPLSLDEVVTATKVMNIHIKP